jgi:hypothetical protein
MQQRIPVDRSRHDDIAAVPAIATARPPARNVFLAPESETSVAAVACFDGDSDFIYKHEKGRWSLQPAARLLEIMWGRRSRLPITRRLLH